MILEGIIHMGQNCKCLKGHILVDAQWHKKKTIYLNAGVSKVIKLFYHSLLKKDRGGKAPWGHVLHIIWCIMT